jgi:hypothetical protein
MDQDGLTVLLDFMTTTTRGLATPGPVPTSAPLLYPSKITDNVDADQIFSKTSVDILQNLKTTHDLVDRDRQAGGKETVYVNPPQITAVSAWKEATTGVQGRMVPWWDGTCILAVGGDAVDTLLCAAVAGADLATAVKCQAVLTSSTADAAGTKACTYTPGNRAGGVGIADPAVVNDRFQIGKYTVTYSAEDSFGNQATPCNVEVEIKDCSAPTFNSCAPRQEYWTDDRAPGSCELSCGKQSTG